MNQRGDCTLFGVLILLAMSSLLTLTSLSLLKSFRQLKHRSSLILCLKEIKGEEKMLYQFIGKTNWAIKNITKAKILMKLIPGFQVGSLKAEAMKKMIQKSQNIKLLSHLKKMITLKGQNCSIPYELMQSPYALSSQGLTRNPEGLAILRNQEWNYLFHKRPYFLKMKCQAKEFEVINPKLQCSFSESAVTLFSPSF